MLEYRELKIRIVREGGSYRTHAHGPSGNASGHFVPPYSSAELNELLGAEVYFKCENLQRGGAFKFRGAYSLIAGLTLAAVAAAKEARVRRIGEVGYDNPLFDGLMTHDQVDMFNGPLDRYTIKLLGKKVVFTAHNIDDRARDGVPTGGANRASLRFLYRRVDHVFVHTDRMKRELRELFAVPETGVTVVPLGINLEGHAPRPVRESPPFTIGYFGRIAPEKGLYVLCEAYKRLRGRPGFTNARLEVAGYLGAENRGYLQELERQMEGWGLGREFRYRGVLSRNEKIRFLQGLDVLSVPSSYADPKGTYLLEAMANGVPVVQPRRGAFPEIIEKTGGGILVEPELPDGLADGIYSIWKDPELAARLSVSGAAGVREHYSAARMAARALEVYEDVRKAALQPA